MDVRARNHVVETGRADGPVVVLSHGFGCDQNMWRLVVPALGPRRAGRPLRPRGCGPVGPVGVERAAPRRRCTATRTTCWRSCASWTCTDVVFVGHSVSAMIGVLAAARGAGAFRGAGAAHAVAALRRRRGLPRRLLRRRHRRAARVAGQQLPGLVRGHGAGDHGQPGAAGAGGGADQQLLPHGPADRAGLRPGHVPVRQPRRPRAGDGADARRRSARTT